MPLGLNAQFYDKQGNPDSHLSSNYGINYEDKKLIELRMPNGKPAGVACINLDPIDYSCTIWGKPNYPDLCRQFIPCADVCGDTREQALLLIGDLEVKTAPS